MICGPRRGSFPVRDHLRSNYLGITRVPGSFAVLGSFADPYSTPFYYMALQIRALWLVLSWSGFRHTDRFCGNRHKLCIFLFSKAGRFKTSMARVPYNKLLTNLASSSRTREYWLSVVFVRTSLRSVRTVKTSGRFSPSAARLALG